MDLPELRYSYADGRKASEFIIRDGIECRYVQSADGNGGWYTRKGLALTQNCSINNGQEKEGGQGRQGDERVQAGNAAHRQARARKGASGQEPQASDSHCSI
jgi:hypothetical protein